MVWLKQKWTDEEIVRKICGEDRGRNAALQYWYQQNHLHVWVRQHVMTTSNGSEADAHDTYVETIIVFERLIRNGQFKHKSSLSTFFMGIAKWQWFMIRRKRNAQGTIAPEMLDTFLIEVEDELLNKEKEEVIEQLLGQLGDRCKKVLTLYKLGYSMQEIANLVGFSSDAMAMKEAHNCRKKMKALIESQQDWMDLLKQPNR